MLSFTTDMNQGQKHRFEAFGLRGYGKKEQNICVVEKSFLSKMKVFVRRAWRKDFKSFVAGDKVFEYPEDLFEIAQFGKLSEFLVKGWETSFFYRVFFRNCSVFYGNLDVKSQTCSYEKTCVRKTS